MKKSRPANQAKQNSRVKMLFDAYRDKNIKKLKVILNVYPELINETNGASGVEYTLLGKACEDGDLKLVRYLLNCPNIDISKGKMTDFSNMK